MASSICSRLRNRTEGWISRVSVRKPIEFRLERPIVSFTFDDFPVTASRVAGRMLEDHGFRATYFTSMGLMGTFNELGEHFSAGDLHELSSAGHEIGCHTYSHHTSAELSPDDLRRDVMANAQQLSKELPGIQLDVFSCPKGVVKPNHQRQLSKHFRCLRTIFPGVNRGTFDLNHIKAVSLYESAFDKSRAAQLLGNIQQQTGWLVFYTHDVRDQPSRFGITPSGFRDIVERVIASGAEVCTISQALDKIGAPRDTDESRARLQAAGLEI